MSESQHLRCNPFSIFLFAGRFSVGQNVYQSSSKGVSPNGNQDWKAAVQSWYNEVKDFNRNDVSPFK
jgi:hypothetical protein